ncbi:outer membrane beta-barrel protein [Hymenobacter convexus]|uniref:outer membrane beta-barrel protein n=1 Tax=Hymenobacter sp. CA1UV-4 TaxID=3063782 RepID=UPI0027130F31|nr:outer membrane beta-barrel protein [Hymenobacter sp. CA1UV-4]MDO7853802.1 outer membrane beta-barrel protein [Hymenobacter sp. CA1UV-4]
MLSSRLALGALLLAAPVLGHAQTSPATDATAAPRFYVGLGAYSSYYQRFGREYLGTGAQVRVPVQLTAGYQLRPRLAVQLGVAYSGISQDYATAYYVYYTMNAPAGYTESKGAYTSRRTSVSALARYTLTRNLSHRLQFDALGGLTLERSSSHSKGIRSDSVQNTFVTAPYDYRYAQNNLVLSLGAGVCYRIAPRFDLTYDLLLNGGVWSDQSYLYKGLSFSNALGLRYRFGQR